MISKYCTSLHLLLKSNIVFFTELIVIIIIISDHFINLYVHSVVQAANVRNIQEFFYTEVHSSVLRNLTNNTFTIFRYLLLVGFEPMLIS